MRLWIKLVLGVSTAAAVWGILFINPLPNDEEMIAHFTSNRGEIESLVKRYREYERPENAPLDWSKLPEVLALQARAGVQRVHNTGTLWLPDPYSVATGKSIESFIRKEPGFQKWRRYNEIAVTPRDQRYGMRAAIVCFSFLALIWKEYLWIPETPKIENDLLWLPAGSDGVSRERVRVFKSLNWYPPDWKKGECVLRQIDARWFIRMCWGVP